MLPLPVMVHLPRVSRDHVVAEPAKPPRLYTARHGAARRGDLRRGGVLAGKLALGALVPAARVVEIALEDVHDTVDPRRQGRLLLLHDLVRLLPVARRQELHRLSERLAHVILTFLPLLRSRGSAPARGPGSPPTTPRPPAAAAPCRGRPP